MSYSNLLLICCVAFSWFSCRPGSETSGKWIKSDTVFASLPEALEAPERAKVLIIRNVMPSGKQISNPKHIDGSIKQLIHLHTLIIYGVAQPGIPSEIVSLSKLTRLQLHGYGLVEKELAVPADLSALEHLQQLTIAQCKLSSLPILPLALRQVDFSRNALTDIPNSLLSDKIQVLDISENQIRSFPISGSPKGLRKLYLHDNAITSLEFLNSSFEALEFVSISQNPIDTLYQKEAPPSISRVEAIGIDYSFMKGLITSNTEHVWLTEPRSHEEKVAIEMAHPGASVNWFYRAK